MSFTIKLQKMSCPKNQISKGSSISDIAELTGRLKDSSSIIDPSILIEIEDINDLNRCDYMYIPSWKRHYFINNITSVRNNIYMINAHEDVLYTYHSEILDNKAIVHRSGTSYSLFLDDAQFKVYNCPHILTKNFPAGFPKDNEFLLAVSG